MKKSYIYILIAILVIGGFFYYTLDKEDKNPAGGHLSQGEENEPDANEPNDSDNEDNKGSETNQPNGPLKEEETIELGKKLPNFTLMNMAGEEKSLSEYEGKIVFINFWATWCGFCDAEMPDLQKISEKYDDVVVLGVNVEEEKSLVEKYLKEGGYTFEVLLDEKGEISMEYMISGLPNTYFVDKEGLFQGRWPGMMTYEQMEDVIKDLRSE